MCYVAAGLTASLPAPGWHRARGGRLTDSVPATSPTAMDAFGRAGTATSAAELPRRPDVVAQRGHLPGLRPELRRRQRRRHRRPGRRPGSRCRTCATSASTRSGSRPGTSRRWRTAATTSPTTGAIDPAFGTLAEAEALIAEALELGHPHDRRHRPEPRLRPAPVVPGGARGRRPARRSASGSGSAPGAGRTATRCRPAGPRSSRAPRGPARPNPDGTPGEWYLHLFAAEQPDLNWDHPDVRRGARGRSCGSGSTAGAAGVRIDSAALLVKDPALPEVPADPLPGAHPTHDRDELHDDLPGLARRRRLLSAATASSSARSGCPTPSGSPGTCGRTSCTPRSTSTSWPGRGTPPRLRASIDATLAAHAPVGAPATWVLSNHDVTRPVTRYGRQDTSFAFARKRLGTPTDLDARAAPGAGGGAARRGPARLALPLPGRRAGARRGRGPAGDEIQDPMYFRSGGVDPGRDGCRVPLPWCGTSRRSASAPTAHRRQPWLTQPAHWAALTVERQVADPDSMLSLYRAALRIRRAEPGLGDGSLAWLASGARRARLQRAAPDFVCVTNLSRRRRRAAARSATCSSPAPTSRTGTSRPTRRPGCGRHRAALGGQHGRVPDER